MSSETSEAPEPKPSKPARAEAPRYHGHRQRLRERFRSAGAAALSDYELLEMVLFAGQPRRDMKPLAKALLERFGSFAEVIRAPETLLREVEVEGVRDSCIDQLKLIAAAATRVNAGRAQIAHVALVMERGDRLLPHQHGLRRLGAVPHPVPGQAQPAHRRRGAADRHRRPYSVYPCEVIKRALELSATAIILLHNHPSGDPTPSQADVRMTKAIVDIATPLGIAVHDHIIVGKGGHASLKGVKLK
jgi:DNA repair protein RadC